MACIKFLKSLQSKLADFFGGLEDEMQDDETGGRQSRSKDIRRVKDIKKPKVDLSNPTKRYRKQQRKLLKDKNADIKNADLQKAIEKSWSQLTKQQRMKYLDGSEPITKTTTSKTAAIEKKRTGTNKSEKPTDQQTDQQKSRN